MHTCDHLFYINVISYCPIGNIEWQVYNMLQIGTLQFVIWADDGGDIEYYVAHSFFTLTRTCFLWPWHVCCDSDTLNNVCINFSRLQDSLAEWSKALASGASPEGRGFEPHSCHLLYYIARSSMASMACSTHTYSAQNLMSTDDPIARHADSVSFYNVCCFVAVFTEHMLDFGEPSTCKDEECDRALKLRFPALVANCRPERNWSPRMPKIEARTHQTAPYWGNAASKCYFDASNNLFTAAWKKWTPKQGQLHHQVVKKRICNLLAI